MKRWTVLSWLVLALALTALLALPGGPRTTAAPARQTERPLFLTDPVPDPQQPGVQYFPATGHTLRGAFLAYWDTHGGLFVHGYPLTEPFPEQSPTDGRIYTVQYFERSRFELHPENAGTPYEVLLGLLGTQLAQKQGYPYGWYPQY